MPVQPSSQVHLPQPVAETTRSLMDRFDSALPGKLIAFYLVGSIALGDYQPGQSDIDFIGVLSGDDDTDAIAAVHTGLAADYPATDCDGIYLQFKDLLQPPRGLGLAIRAGILDQQSPDERHLVTWLTLAEHGIALRGPVPNASWIAADRAAAVQYSRNNLASYWQPWVKIRRSTTATSVLLSDDELIWGALGVARVHATMATQSLISKTSAAKHALKAFPQHSKLVNEALRLRTARPAISAYVSPQDRRNDLIDFMVTVIASAA
jgi:hypothetical protein